MIRFALMLAALLLAGMPAAIGLMRSSSSTSETPVHVPEQTTSPWSPERPDPRIDDRNGRQDRDSGRTDRRQAHNEGDDRTARSSRPAS
jgi:hypothetical protein